MAGPVRVMNPIGNALGDYALCGGIIWGLGPACCYDTDCPFVFSWFLIFSNDVNADCKKIHVGMHENMSIKKNNHVNPSRNKEIARNPITDICTRRRNSAPVSMETQNVNKPNRTEFFIFSA